MINHARAQQLRDMAMSWINGEDGFKFPQMSSDEHLFILEVIIKSEWTDIIDDAVMDMRDA